MNIEKAKLIEGWMYESELEQLAIWASTHYRILELGSWKGRSTRALCDNTPGFVIAIDTFAGPDNVQEWAYDFQEPINFGSEYIKDIFINNLKDCIENYKLTYLWMRDTEAAYKLKNIFGRKKFDMVFIDADHRYEYGCRDIRLYKPLVSGLICGHDYNWEGIQRAVNELLPNRKLVGNLWYAEV